MKPTLVFLVVFFIAACGLGYELVAGTLASYLLGDSVTQFSVAIGLYLFAMGAGAWLSKFLERRLVATFVDIELAVALAGGTSAAVLYLAFERGVWFRPILYGEIFLVGTLVGLEIPLLMRILKDEIEFKDLVAKVLTFDYVGALIVSLVFPLVFVPHLGVVRSALAFGIVNAVVALWSTWVFASRLRGTSFLRLRCLAVLGVLCAGFVFADAFQKRSEELVYGDEIVFSKTTPYQRMVVTQNPGGFQLYLNGGLQFSSVDEYRYHEALVHPAFAVVPEPRRVLVLGGGDGLALREILTYPQVERVTLVDIDPAVVELARTFEPLMKLNRRAYDDPRVTVVHDDAMRWLVDRPGLFDVIVVDFPDPSTFPVGKLYTTTFYDRLQTCLAADGAIAVQSTSPLFSRRSFWCITRTIESRGLFARPYHALVPSFGEWGFVLASRRSFDVPARAPSGGRYLDAGTMAAMFEIPPDMEALDVEPNRLDNQILVHYYEDEWRRLN